MSTSPRQSIAAPARGRVLRSITQPDQIGGQTYWNCNLVEFDGMHYLVSHRAILTVVVVAACNAGCRFCSNEITFTPSGRYLTWGSKLKRAKEFALVSGVTKIAYTGGEPTLNPQLLLDLMGKLNPGFARARLHTNGWGLHKTVHRDGYEVPLLDGLIGRGLTGVSVSVAHCDPEANREIMVLPKSWKGLTEDELRDIADRGNDRFTPRLSCVLTEGGISSLDDMFAYMAWGRALGFRRFIFRSCSAIPDSYKKDTSYSRFNDANYTEIESIAGQLETFEDIELAYRQRKSDSKVDVYRWGDITFDVDESSEEPDPDDKIRRLNLMTNAVMYKSWIDPLSVVFPDDRPAAQEAAAREFGVPA